MHGSDTSSTTSRRIYLDNAATSWPKPASVYEALDRYQREIGAPHGRGGYRAAEVALRLVEKARRRVATLLGVQDAERIIFTSSGTDALNTAILGIVRPGDHVVTTVCEHNSVLRPLKYLAEQAQVEVSYIPCNEIGYIAPDDIGRALKPQTRLVVVTHVSNVTGAIQPIEEIGNVVHSHGAYFLVDAAQSLGHVPLSIDACRADLLAAPGHKGLLGPLGTGVLCLSERVADVLQPLRRGGTGTASEEENQPRELPHRFEAGNLNVPALAGLAEGVGHLEQHSITAIQLHQQQLVERLLNGLESLAGLRLYGPGADQPRTSVVSFACAGYDPQEVAAVLEIAAGVECRAGLHCAPRMHRALGTLAQGGTVRLSPGWATTQDQIDILLEAVEQILTRPSN